MTIIVTNVGATTPGGTLQQQTIARLTGWSPNSELNCVTTALYAGGWISDLTFIDPDKLASHILPYCFVKQDSLSRDTLVLSFGTSRDGSDYRRLLHANFWREDGVVFNKPGSRPENLISVQTFDDPRPLFKSYFEDMRQLLRQPITAQIESYRRSTDPRCPLNDYTVKFSNYLAEFTQRPLRAMTEDRVNRRSETLGFDDVISRAELLALYARVNASVTEADEAHWRLTQRTAKTKNLPLASNVDIARVQSIIAPNDMPIVERSFYLELVRKQVLMALGLRETDPIK